MTDLAPYLAMAPDDLVAALVALPAKERKALAPLLKNRSWDERKDVRHALLVLGCLDGVRQVAAALELCELGREHVPLAARLLADRRPPWLDRVFDALPQEWWFPSWALTRALVAAGAIDRPDDPRYVGRLVYGAVGSPWPPDAPAALDALRADPALLDEVWPMLALDDAGEALAGLDKHFDNPSTWGHEPVPARPRHTWRHALVTLAAEGALDRGRLLDASLDAFLRDWRAAALPWFVTLHDALAPAPAELAARQGTYARLLALAYGPAVALAQRAFGRLVAEGGVDAELLLAASPAVLLRADKGPVVAHLKLLAALATARPDLAAAVAEVAAHALEHPKADVRDRARALAGTAPAPVAVAARAEPAWERPAPAPVTPVADADELAELFARLIEEADDAVEVERALEGVARLARQRPRHGGEALARRAEERIGELYPGPWQGDEPRADLAALVRAWLADEDPGPRYVGPPTWIGVGRRRDLSLPALVTRRVHEVAVAVRAGGAAPLSLPATADGAIPAAVLTDRLRALGRTARPLPLDAGVAALRVPPDGYGAVTAPAAHRAGRAVAAALDVLGAYRPDWERVLVPPGAGARQPEAHGVTWRDRRSPAGHEDDAVATALDRSDPGRVLHADGSWGAYAARHEQVQALCAALLPHHPELLAAHAHAALHRGLRMSRSGSGPLLDALARSPARTGPVTCSALVLGLSLNDAGDRTRAVDALADLARAGLLDGAELGRQAALSLAGTAAVGSRVAAALDEAARTGPAASAAVLAASRELLPALPGRRDAHLFVDLLARVAAEHGATVALPDEFARLAAGRSASVLAAACRRVPA